MGFLYGIARAGQVVERQLDIRVIDRLLEHLAIASKKAALPGSASAHHPPDRPFEGITFYGAVDSHE